MSGVFRIGDLKPWKYFLTVSLALGVLFALIGPDGDAAFGWAGLMLQWLIQALVPTALGVMCHILLHRSARFDRLNPWLKLLLSGSAAAVLFSPVAYSLDVIFNKETAWQGIAGWTDELAGVYLPVTIAWVAMNAPFLLGYQLLQQSGVPPAPKEPAEPSQDASTPNFMKLIPTEQRGDVISLKAELHYLCVTTTYGQSLVLYNLSDAINELPPSSGIQTHRSYWAGFTFIKTLTRSGRNASLKMKDGSTIPVSRARLKTVQEALKR